MKQLRQWMGALAGVATALALAGCVTTPKAPVRFAGAQCVSPPVMRCPDKDCPGEMVVNAGPVVEPKSGRNYFLDYPCDLKPGENVTVVLALHGGGSYGNWQRHYFPIVDYVTKYRLVVATPNTRAWSPNDDAYLQNIVTNIVDTIGKDHVKSFWLIGHSMGSFNSRRLVCTDFFKTRVDGYFSMSGGRVGSPASDGPTRFNIPRQDDSITKGQPAPGPGGGAGGGGPPGGLLVTGQGSLDCDFSFLYEGGSQEPSQQNLPATSTWAEKYSCGARVETKEVVDTKGGYVYDSSRQQYGNPGWGRLPRAGTAKVMEYPHCKDGKIVADVIRIDKGHTEGIEPQVTEQLIKMMLSAQGGKIRKGV